MALSLSPKQREVAKILQTKKYSLVYGGSRGGKTFGIVAFIVSRAFMFSDCRQMIFRKVGRDIRSSIWKDTLPKVLREMDLVAGQDYESNELDMEIRLKNGSVIGCAGLDDKERVDKVLGQEFSTIYINESQDVPHQSVTTLLTRLSQRCWHTPADKTKDKIEIQTKFIADLNPTGVSHWTYKLWFLGVNPQNGEKLKNPERYGKIKVSPADNPNLSTEYIEDVLGSLVGNQRKRFLEGDYTSTDDLIVFQGQGIPKDSFVQAFTNWRIGKRVQITAGLDLGYNDADAFIVLAFAENHKEVWLLYQHKKRKSTVTDLVRNINVGLEYIRSTYGFNEEDIPIYTDTGGGGKKVFSELESVYGLNVLPAYKRNKALSIDLLQDEVNHGNFIFEEGSEWDDECKQVCWTRDENAVIIREIDDDNYHPDMMDAIIYAYHTIWDYTNRNKEENDTKVPTIDPHFDLVINTLKEPGGYW